MSSHVFFDTIRLNESDQVTVTFITDNLHLHLPEFDRSSFAQSHPCQHLMSATSSPHVHCQATKQCPWEFDLRELFTNHIASLLNFHACGVCPHDGFYEQVLHTLLTTMDEWESFLPHSIEHLNDRVNDVYELIPVDLTPIPVAQ